MFTTVVLVSIFLASVLILRQAKLFAQKPPAPLIDMDRMYDVVFEKLDEETGSKVTPEELDEILHSFVHVLSQHHLIRESINESADEKNVETRLKSSELAKKVKEHRPNLDVDYESMEKVIDQTFNYLEEINAIITEV